MTPVASAASQKRSPRRYPGFLLSPFGWAAEPLAAMVNAEPVAKLATMSAGVPVGRGRSVLGRQFASAANDAACKGRPRSAP
jgi:hypothetical protein